MGDRRRREADRRRRAARVAEANERLLIRMADEAADEEQGKRVQFVLACLLSWLVCLLLM